MTEKKKEDVDIHQLINTVHELGINVITREIYLNGDTTDRESDENIDYRVATKFVKNIHILNALNHEPIIIHCMSPGGEWEAGMAMYDAIKSSPSPTTIVIHGKAFSMASIIMQAANIRLLHPYSLLMIHYGWAGSCNTSLGAIEEARVESIRNRAMLDIYSERCQNGIFFTKQSMSKCNVSLYIDKRIKNTSDCYLTAKEAVYYGFADSIIEPLIKKQVKKSKR